MADRLLGRVVHGTKPGPIPYLSYEEEDVESCELGYGKNWWQVKSIVENVAIEKKRSEQNTEGWDMLPSVTSHSVIAL